MRSIWLGLGAMVLAACGGGPRPQASEWQKPAPGEYLSAGAAASRVQAAFAGPVAILVWTEDQQLYRAEDTGSGFSTPEAMNAPGTRVYAYALAASRMGQAVLVWREDSRIEVALRSASGWAPTINLGLGEGSRLAAAIDNYGSGWLARQVKVGSEHRVRVSHWDGQSWNPSFETPAGSTASSPSLAAYRRRALLAWAEPSGGSAVWASLFDGGWKAPKRFALGFTNGNPMAALGDAGAAVAWRTTDPAPGAVGSALARERSGSWETSVIGSGASEAKLASLPQSLLAVWQQRQSGVSAIFAKHYRQTPAQDRVLSLPGLKAEHPGLAAFQDQALVAWVQDLPGGGRGILAAELGPRGWRLPTPDDVLSPAGGAVLNKTPAVALGVGGRALVAWIQRDATGVPRVYLARRR